MDDIEIKLQSILILESALLQITSINTKASLFILFLDKFYKYN